MKNMFFVFRHEVYTIFHRRSFLWMVIWLPLLSFMAVAIFSAVRQGRTAAPVTRLSERPASSVEGEAVNEVGSKIDGFIDQSGLLVELPESISGLQRYASEAAGREAIENGEIRGLYMIPGDYLESGQLTYLQGDFDPLPVLLRGRSIETALRYNLLRSEPGLANRLLQPVDMQVTLLSPEEGIDPNNAVGFLFPLALTMLLYLSILMSAGFLLTSLQKERENRVLEILLASVDSKSMFFGKVLALGLAGLVQTAIWLLSGYGMLRVSGRVVEVLENFRLPAEFWLWTLAFFLAGYLLYASLMAGIGALTPNLREASQMTLIVNLPLMIPLVASGLFALSPNHALLTVLSFIPLTAPLAMVQRMVLLELPTWQPILSILLLGLTGAMVIRGTAGLFRAQTLLQGGSAWERLGRQLGRRREVRI